MDGQMQEWRLGQKLAQAHEVVQPKAVGSILDPADGLQAPAVLAATRLHARELATTLLMPERSL
jgi:hypothetical protein